MKICFLKAKYLFFILFFLSFPKIYGEDYFLKNISNQESKIILKSNYQASDLENSIFSDKADVLITNNDQEFVAKANKAIILKSTRKIKFIGGEELSADLFNKIKAAEIICFLKEKNIEAISDINQKVKTTLVFNEDKIANPSKER